MNKSKVLGINDQDLVFLVVLLLSSFEGTRVLRFKTDLCPVCFNKFQLPLVGGGSVYKKKNIQYFISIHLQPILLYREGGWGGKEGLVVLEFDGVLLVTVRKLDTSPGHYKRANTRGGD